MLETIDHGKVTEIRFARPPVNALDPSLVAALDEALVEATGDARAVVLSGQPGMFSAGLDMKALLALDRAAITAFWESFFALLRRLATSPVPVIAAITGHSPAGGAVLAMFCDRRIAAEGDFKLGLNEVQVGLAMPPVIFAGLKRLIGVREAEKMCVAGSLIGPDAAQAIGLVDEVVPVEQVVPRALAYADSLVALPPGAMSVTRGLCRADLEALFAGIDTDTAREMSDAWFSDETQATMKAVLAALAAKR